MLRPPRRLAVVCYLVAMILTLATTAAAPPSSHQHTLYDVKYTTSVTNVDSDEALEVIMYTNTSAALMMHRRFSLNDVRLICPLDDTRTCTFVDSQQQQHQPPPTVGAPWCECACWQFSALRPPSSGGDDDIDHDAWLYDPHMLVSSLRFNGLLFDTNACTSSSSSSTSSSIFSLGWLPQCTLHLSTDHTLPLRPRRPSSSPLPSSSPPGVSVYHHRIIRVVERASKLSRAQIPSLVQLGVVVSRRHRGSTIVDFSITTPPPPSPSSSNTSSQRRFAPALVARFVTDNNNNSSSSSTVAGQEHSSNKVARVDVSRPGMEIKEGLTAGPRFASALTDAGTGARGDDDDEASAMDPDEIKDGLDEGFDEETPTDDEGDGEIASDPMMALGFILQIIVEAALGDSIEEAAEELEEHVAKLANELIAEHMNEEAFYDGTEGRRRRLLSIRQLLVSSGVSADATDALMAKHGAKTPPFAVYAIENLIPELSASITNEISLSYVEMLTGLLWKSIHDHLDQGDVASQITEQVHVTVTSGAKKNLQKTIPLAVQRILPPLIVDQLIHTLTHTMTRSLVHVLAPTLTFTLSHSAAEHLACAFCRAHGSWCNQCVAHPDEIYRKIYVADYYSSYYTDYYIPRLYQPI